MNNEISEIGIVGNDTVGREIAISVANSGLPVIMQDITATAIAKSREHISLALDNEIARWGMTNSEKTAVLSLITSTTKLSDLAERDMVIEAVPEDIAEKQEIFTRLDKVCSQKTILVANPATLSITEISRVTNRTDRCIGLHFLTPVFKVPIVEVIRAVYTSDETVGKVLNFLSKLGKQPVKVFESAGYITTRCSIPMINEAMYVLMEGVATAEDIDKAMKYGFNFRVGPLQLADIIGLDKLMHWMESLFRETGDPKFRPCPILRLKVRAGQLGVKTKSGFFKYDDKDKKLKNIEV